MDVFKNQRRICALVVVCCIAIFELFAQEFEFVQKIPDSSFMLNDAVIFIDNETIAVFKGETLRF
ncbi:hypothetical protein [Treponema sp. J25]|uniref:hypothetical protein n=1 Tax=Treponema sp. J25 TaxID=2094121 RepID=UPI0010518993|nr:hypothetical protein [Treponema sp. J25]TCW62223.1 hypothetical protein C5O22_02350 [Treponema sp. J25]